MRLTEDRRDSVLEYINYFDFNIIRVGASLYKPKYVVHNY